MGQPRIVGLPGFEPATSPWKGGGFVSMVRSCPPTCGCVHPVSTSSTESDSVVERSTFAHEPKKARSVAFAIRREIPNYSIFQAAEVDSPGTHDRLVAVSSRVMVRFSRRRSPVVRRGMVVLARRRLEASWFHPGAEAESSLRCHRRGTPEGNRNSRKTGPSVGRHTSCRSIRHPAHVALYGHV